MKIPSIFTKRRNPVSLLEQMEREKALIEKNRQDAVISVKSKEQQFREDRNLALSKKDTLRYVYDTAVLYVIRNIDVLSGKYNSFEIADLVPDKPAVLIDEVELLRLKSVCSNPDCNGYDIGVDPDLPLKNYSINDVIGCGLSLLSPEPLPYSDFLK